MLIIFHFFMYKKNIKRLLGFCIALVSVICLSPVLLVVSVWLYFANEGAGVFYSQLRPGRNERIFKLYKFKSMTDRRDANGYLLPDELRLTTVGRFIRKTSIDELPQLLNVLKGDMALIGPRPLYVKYLPYYTERERKRHTVRPGITGWAQVNGRNQVKWDDRLEYDAQYVERLFFSLDCKILWMTVMNVLRRKDIDVAAGNYELDAERKLPSHEHS